MSSGPTITCKDVSPLPQGPGSRAPSVASQATSGRISKGSKRLTARQLEEAQVCRCQGQCIVGRKANLRTHKRTS
jgi:hypothetical protein